MSKMMTNEAVLEMMWALVDEVRYVIRTRDEARGAALLVNYPTNLVEAVCIAETGLALDGTEVL